MGTGLEGGHMAGEGGVTDQGVTSQGSLEGALTAATAGTEPGVSGESYQGQPTAPASGAPAAAVASQPLAGAGAAGSAEWTGVRDYLKAKGIELPFEDDGAALEALGRAYQGSQQRNYFTELGQRLAPHAKQLQAYLAQQAAAVQQAAPAASWAAPEFKKEWMNLVERDENTGALRSKAGYDPGIADKVQAYADWRDRFLDSPETVIGPLVEQRAAALIEQRFASHSEQVAAQAIVQQNADWIFQKGADGRPVRGQFTPEGVLFSQTTQRLWDSGLTDVNVIAGLARTVVENAVLRRHLQGQASPAAAQAVLAANGSPSVGPGVVGGNAPPPSQAGLSLRERLERATAGLNEPDF